MRGFGLALLVVFLLPNTARATAQFPDILTYKGEKVSIFSNPLEQYFSEENPRPGDLFQALCSACWRGYVATWEIKDDGYLYLIKVIEGTCDSNAPEIPLSKLFPGQEGPIKATWFTGTLTIPGGRQVEYVHMGYESKYERYTFVEIEQGKVTREQTEETKLPAPEKDGSE